MVPVPSVPKKINTGLEHVLVIENELRVTVRVEFLFDHPFSYQYRVDSFRFEFVHPRNNGFETVLELHRFQFVRGSTADRGFSFPVLMLLEGQPVENRDVALRELGKEQSPFFQGILQFGKSQKSVGDV